MPEVQPILSDLRRQAESADVDSLGARTLTLESALQDYLDRGTFDPNVFRHIAAMRFYLRDLLWETAENVLRVTGGVTMYTDLVSRCYQWGRRTGAYVSFVSFNYDHLLDSACESHFQLDPLCLSTYVEDDRVSVLKPHGSVLWAWPHPNVEPVEGVSDPVGDAIRAGEPESLYPGSVSTGRSPVEVVNLGPQRYVPAYPALALPMASKSQLVWPPEQDALFREDLPNGSFGRVLLVGWRAAEPHFLSLLERLIPPDSKVLVVTGATTPAIATNDYGRDTREFEHRCAKVGRSL